MLLYRETPKSWVRLFRISHRSLLPSRGGAASRESVMQRWRSFDANGGNTYPTRFFGREATRIFFGLALPYAYDLNRLRRTWHLQHVGDGRRSSCGGCLGC